jgi:hypothetical protein
MDIFLTKSETLGSVVDQFQSPELHCQFILINIVNVCPGDHSFKDKGKPFPDLTNFEIASSSSSASDVLISSVVTRLPAINNDARLPGASLGYTPKQTWIPNANIYCQPLHDRRNNIYSKQEHFKI